MLKIYHWIVVPERIYYLRPTGISSRRGNLFSASSTQSLLWSRTPLRSPWWPSDVPENSRLRKTEILLEHNDDTVRPEHRKRTGVATHWMDERWDHGPDARVLLRVTECRVYTRVGYYVRIPTEHNNDGPWKITFTRDERLIEEDAPF